MEPEIPAAGDDAREASPKLLRHSWQRNSLLCAGKGRHSVWSLHPAWNCWVTRVWHRNRRTRSAPCARPQARVLCYWVWLLERTRPPTGTMFGKTASSRSRVRTDSSKALHVVVTGPHLTFLCPVIPSRCRCPHRPAPAALHALVAAHPARWAARVPARAT